MLKKDHLTLHTSVLLVISVALLLSGCQLDNLAPNRAYQREQKVTIEATYELPEMETKTVRDDNAKIYWTPGDAISLFFGSGTNGGSRFIAQNDDVALKTTFSGSITAVTGGSDIDDEDTYFWGLYPYDETSSCDGSSVTMSIPAVQPGMEGTFAPGMAPSLGRSQKLVLSFRNIWSGFGFTVSEAGFQSVTFKGNAGENIAGKARIGIDENNLPKVLEILEGVQEVTLTAPDDAGFVPGQYYYMQFFPCTFESGFTVELESATQRGTYHYTKSMEYPRSTWKRAANVDTRVKEWRDRVMPDEGGTVNLVVFTDKASHVEIPLEAQSWISYVSTSSDSNSQTITLAIQANVGAERNATVFVKSNDGAFSQPFTIKQSPGHAYQLAIEREALIVLYNALDGDNWTNNENWCSNKPVGEWFGVMTYDGYGLEGLVSSIDLSGNNLCGQLPSNISSFNHIVSVDFSYNDISGTIPDEYAKLFGNNRLQLNHNPLTGTIPAAILTNSYWQYEWANFLYDTNLDVGPKDIPLPSFSIIDTDGNPIDSDIIYASNQLVIFVNWHNNWLECNDRLIPYYEAFKEKGLFILGMVLPSDEEQYRNNKQHFPWPTLIAQEGNSISPYVTYPTWRLGGTTIFNSSDYLFLGSSSLDPLFDCRNCIEYINKAFDTQSSLPEGEIPPDDEIWYTTTDGSPISITVESVFGVPILSNSYDKYGVIKFASTLTSIGTAHYECQAYENQGAFALCETLKEIVLPNTITEIGDYSFASCSQMTSVILPQSCTKIGYCAFEGCVNLESIEFPDNLEGIGEYAFSTCRKIAHVLFPEGLQYLGYAAFTGCKKLTNIVLPESLQYMGPGVFGEAEILSFSGKFATPDGLALIEPIGQGVYFCEFARGVSMDKYIIPDGVTSVGGFYGSKIREVVLPESVKEIRNQAFELSSLAEINLPNGLETIGDEAFFRAQVSNISLPSSLISIGQFAFDDHLIIVNSKSYIPAKISQYAFSYNSEADTGFEIRVPRGFKEVYSQEWIQYEKSIVEYDFDDIENPGYYVSSDFSHDGETKTLQESDKVGEIDLILMGDAFSDRQIADGTYDSVMRDAMDAFFSEEPYKSFKNRFNVSYVNVVSLTEGYVRAGQALLTGFGEGTRVYGDDNKVISYAQNVVPSERLDDALIIVTMNKDAYAGTCYMYNPVASGDYGHGLSIAYFPICSDTNTFNGLVLHEAGGHGFAKLADEYAYEYMGAISQEAIDGAHTQEAWGWWKNVDFTNNPTQVKWGPFISDNRYANEGIGCYEGGMTYWTGVWRPTENSIMRNNTGGFNAPSRYAIWYRINKLAYGDDWNGTYEDFVAYDAVNRTSAATAQPGRNYVLKQLPPLAPPVVVGHSWRDAK